MREVTAAEPLPAQGLDEQITRALAAIEAGSQVAREAIEGRGDLLELVMWSARLAEAEQAIRQAAMFTAVNEIAALSAVPQPARRARARHARGRVPRQRAADGQIALFPSGGRLAGAIVAALSAVRLAARHAARPVRHVLPHSWKAAIVAHKAAAVAFAVGATATVATVGAMVIPAGVHAITSGGAPAPTAAGAPGLYGAVPVSPDLDPVYTRSTEKTRSGKADTSSAGLAAAPLPPLISTAPVQPPAQPTSPAPSFTPSYPPMSAPPPGQLQVSSGSIDVSSGQPQTITLTAAAGPVFWDADATGAGATDVVLTAVRGDGTPMDRLQGWLMPGETVNLTVTPSAAQDGSTQTTVDLGNGVTFTVTLVDPVPAASAPASPSPASS